VVVISTEPRSPGFKTSLSERAFLAFLLLAVLLVFLPRLP